MMRMVWRIFGAIIAALVLVVGGVLLLPQERLARIAASQIEAATGRAVTLSGQPRVSLWPVLGVATGPMALANAPWAADAGPLLQADDLKISVDVAGLLQGAVRITGFEAVNPTIRLQRAADGRENWRLGVQGVAPSGQAPGAGNALALSLDRAVITGGALRFDDARAGTRLAYDDVDFLMLWPDAAGAAQMRLAAAPYGQPLVVEGQVAHFADWIAGQAVALEAAFSAAGARIDYDGTGDLNGFFQGRLGVDVPNSAALLAALGQAGTDVPQGLGRRIKGQAQLSLGQGRVLALDDLQLGLDGQALQGALKVQLGQTPRLTGALAAGQLDLSGLMAGGDRAAGAGAGWSASPIDASALGLFDADVTLSAQALRLGRFALGRTQLRFENTAARAVLTLQDVAAYGGQISGDLVANNRAGLSVGGRLVLQNVDMQALLQAAMGLGRLQATGQGQLQFLGSGASMAAIMRSLSGQGQFATGRGVISGLDLDRLMRGDTSGGGTTVFDQMGASFTISGGVLRNDDFAMALPFARASGAGQVDLGAQELDYTITPQALQARGGKGLAVPVRLVGPWAKPDIRVDLAAAVQDSYEAEIEAAKDAARQQAQDKLGEALGVQPTQGQDLKEAVKDKVKEQVEQELLKGLGRLLKP